MSEVKSRFKKKKVTPIPQLERTSSQSECLQCPLDSLWFEPPPDNDNANQQFQEQVVSCCLNNWNPVIDSKKSFKSEALIESTSLSQKCHVHSSSWDRPTNHQVGGQRMVAQPTKVGLFFLNDDHGRLVMKHIREMSNMVMSQKKKTA